MTLEINIEDYLSREEISEICKETVKNTILTNMTNIAETVFSSEVAKCLDDDIKAEIHKRVKEYITKEYWSYYVFSREKNGKRTLGVQIIDEIVAEHREEIVENVKKAIGGYSYNSEMGHTIGSIIMSYVEEGILKDNG